MVDIKRILCPIDFADHSQKVAEYAASFAKALNAEVVVLYVAPAASDFEGFHTPSLSVEAVDSLVLKRKELAEEMITKFVADNFKGVNARAVVVTGHAADIIVTGSAENNVDLIIMGTHGRSGVNHFVFGSVAEKVIRSAKVPVMAVKPV